MHNSALTDPLIIVKSFSCIMQVWKERFDGKLATMVFIINLQHTKNAWRQQHTLKSSNHKHCYGYGSNGYRIPTLKPMPASNSTIFGRHPPKPYGPQPPLYNIWRNATSTPSPARLPQPIPTDNNHQGYNVYHE